MSSGTSTSTGQGRADAAAATDEALAADAESAADADAARRAELAAIAAVTGGDDDSSASSSSSAADADASMEDNGVEREHEQQQHGEEEEGEGSARSPRRFPGLRLGATATATVAATPTAAAADAAGAAANTAPAPAATNADTNANANTNTNTSTARRGWRDVGAGLLAASRGATPAAMAVELVRTVSGVGMGGRNGDDDSDSESEGESCSDDESDYTSSSGGSGGGGSGASGSSDVGDEEDECTSGPEGARQYREMEQPQLLVSQQQQQQQQQNNSSANGSSMTEMVIEEELPTGRATTTSAAGARWFSARRSALDSVSSVVATGFRGRYAAAAATTAASGATATTASAATRASGGNDGVGGGNNEIGNGGMGGSASSVPRSPAAAAGASKTTPILPLGILPHPSPQTAATATANTSAPGGDINGTSSAPIPPPPTTTTTTTADPYADQVQRIQGLHQPELDDLLATLRPGQYPLLLGRGMLGVNLRQTYGADQNFGAAAATAQQHNVGGAGTGSHGVYVDSVVPRGNADRSGVVHVGDRLVRVGTDRVVRGTIGDVPQRIAALRRPGVLVLATGKEMAMVDVDGDGAGSGSGCGGGAGDMDWVDASIGLINLLAGDGDATIGGIGGIGGSDLVLPKLGDAEEGKDGAEMEPSSSAGLASPASLERTVSLLDADDEDEDEDNGEGHTHTGSQDEDAASTPSPEEEKANDDEVESPYNRVPSVGVTTPMYPPSSVCRELVRLASKRANPAGSISAGTINSLLEDLQMMEEEQRDSGDIADDSQLTCDMKIAKRMTDAFHKALVTICLDPRRSHFLAKHLEYEDKKAVEARKKAVKEMGLPPSDVDEELDRRNSAAILLKYYLDLMSYLVAMETLPIIKRTEQQMRLADAFRDLTTSNLLADRESLAAIKTALDDMLVKGSATQIDRGFMDQVRILVGQSIAISPQFVTFLLGDQCARMRGYLHKTAPYVNVPLCPVINGTINVRRRQSASGSGAHAHNHFLFALLHLICRYEMDGESEEERQGMPVPDKDKTRILGSAGGLACAVFIQGTLLPAIAEAQNMIQQRKEDNTNDDNERACHRSVIAACEQLWEVYVAPAGGILAETVSEESERLFCLLNDVRRALVGAVSVEDQTRSAGVISDETGRKIVYAIVSSTELKVSLEKLAEELKQEYAISTRPEYHAHMFHEWMCGEVHRWAKRRALSPPADLSSQKEALSEGIYPMLEGSITRLMRRVELPKGVSQHRPQRLDASPRPSKPTDSSPAPSAESAEKSSVPPNQNVNAEYAIVFGNDDGMDSTGRVLGLDPSAKIDFGAVRRFTCVKLPGQSDESALDENDIPPRLENYAVVPPIRELPFADIIDEGRLSADGWEISLVNFMVPNSNPGAVSEDDVDDGPFIYGVSLVFNQIVNEGAGDASSLNEDLPKYTTELEYVDASEGSTPGKTNTASPDANSQFVTPSKPNHQVSFLSPITVSRPKREDGTETNEILRKIRVSAQTPEFNRRLSEMRWSERVKKRKASGGIGATVGIALLSGRNTIPAMRDTLSQLFDDYTNVATSIEGEVGGSHLVDGKPGRVCDLLVDILGTLSQLDVEKEALNCILEPYLGYGSSRWIPRLPSEQSREFAATSGAELLESLPPIPLALLFVTLLLEQKIIVSSRRRSVLVSATTALRSLLNPLTWSHLFVPLVPASMAGDLIHYPAPFILGVPSEDEDSMVLLNSLPDDATLVDLDVGRVILASRLSNEEGMDPGMLRSQVLFLAETLGNVFGCKMQGPTWRCDSPLRPFSQTSGGGAAELSNGMMVAGSSNGEAQFAAVKELCKDFIMELLSGTRSCCYWIEEKHPDQSVTPSHECSVLFDEDRFFSIKRLRAEERYMPLLMGQTAFQESCSTDSTKCSLDGPIGQDTILALNPNDFDLVLEVFLRSQGMSTFVSSRQKERMAFW